MGIFTTCLDFLSPQPRHGRGKRINAASRKLVVETFGRLEGGGDIKFGRDKRLLSNTDRPRLLHVGTHAESLCDLLVNPRCFDRVKGHDQEPKSGESSTRRRQGRLEPGAGKSKSSTKKKAQGWNDGASVQLVRLLRRLQKSNGGTRPRATLFQSSRLGVPTVDGRDAGLETLACRLQNVSLAPPLTTGLS